MTDTTRNKLRLWLDLATTEQRAALLAQLGASASNVRQVADGHRDVSAAMAGRIADATATVTGMAALTRADLCAACAGCPHARASRDAVDSILGNPPFSAGPGTPSCKTEGAAVPRQAD